MSIIDTLITDRTQADVTKLKSLLSKPKAMWTNEEWSEFLLAKDKGAYNATDLNRVQEAMEYLAERFRGYGYNVPEIKRPSITEVIPGTSRLPEGYTELEYIESTGTQYIDTGVMPNQNTRVVADVYTESTSAIKGIFGSRSSGTLNGFCVWQLSNTSVGSYYGTLNNVVSMSTVGVRLLIDKNKNITTVNGTETSVNTQTFTGLMSVHLFTVKQADGTFPYAHMVGKFYSCQIWDNGTLVRDYVPCLNPSNEVGLYDIVNGVFYGNSGTGYFLPGPAVSLPDGYTRLEYIQSTGEQFVDTGISVPHATARIIVDFAPTSVAGDHKSITGHANTAFSWTTNFLFINGEKSTITLNGVDTGIVASVGTRYVVDYNQASYSINGGDHVSTTRSFTDGYNDTIFYSSGKYGEFKLYSYQLYNGSTLIRDLAPCKNPDGEVGLYDTITGEFFGNAGTGTFVAGDELGSSDGNIPTQIIERDYWKIGDIPRQEQMALYLTNLGYVKNVLGLLKSTPESPSVMDYLSYAEANNIEQILVDIEFVITHTIQSMSRLNAFMFVSGYRPFPSSASDYGRTWDDIDALELNWDDLDDGEAWYTMQYGVIK